MKRRTSALTTLGILLIASNLFAADFIIDGNVGIGTSTPGDILHIRSGAPYLTLERTGAYAWKYSIGFSYDDFLIWDRNADAARLIITDTGDVGIGTTDPQGYKFYVAGSIYTSVGYFSSDIKFKKNMMDIESPLNKILSAKGVTYNWKTEDYREKGFDERRHYGVIAQEIEKVLPEIVKETPGGEKGVAYTEIIPVLIEAMKEQQKIIDDLKARVQKLEAKESFQGLDK